MGRPPLTKKQKVWNAVDRGLQDAKSISKSSNVEERLVHPYLSQLRSEGRIEGYAGDMRTIY